MCNCWDRIAKYNRKKLVGVKPPSAISQNRITRHKN